MKIEPLVVTRHSSYKADVHSFRFEGLGWALFVFDESSGSLFIHSDYGTWSHIWRSEGRGKGSLMDFFLSCDCDYLARKFVPGDRQDKFDFDKTVVSIKSAILQARREGALTKHTGVIEFDSVSSARDLWDDVLDLEDGSADTIYRSMSPRLIEFLGDLCNYMSYGPSSEFLWLRDGILPAVKSKLKATVAMEAK